MRSVLTRSEARALRPHTERLMHAQIQPLDSGSSPRLAPQRTLLSSVAIEGIGLHSGTPVSLRLRPALGDRGVIFVRRDASEATRVIPANWRFVRSSRLATVIENASGTLAGTVEHLLAALNALEIDNVLVEIDGPEVPILDGSAAPFASMIERAGAIELKAPRKVIRVLRPVMVREGDKCASLSPCAERSFSVSLDFDHPIIRRQSYSCLLDPDIFRRDIAPARTFGFAAQLEELHREGLALGASTENALVLNENNLMDTQCLRLEREFARHKLLDCIGDLYLAGAPIIGAYQGIRPGHSLNVALLQRLFSDRDAWRIENATRS